MRHVRIHRQSDWFYEFKPFFILVFGVIGLFNHSLNQQLMWLRIGQISGLMLILISIKICQWRYEYRTKRSSH